MPRLQGLMVLFVAALPARAAEPWHLADWQARAVVEVARPAAEPGVDVCGVKVLCQGRARPDGADYRVLDAAGKAVPFQLCSHDAERYSLISFKADNPKGRYFVYFDNPKAARAAEQVKDDPTPGSGPPKGAWVPRYGFVLETRERPKGDNPRDEAGLRTLVAGSKVRYGARYQRRVSEGYDLFGPSDYYLSLYRGWVNIPKAGKYQFCTVSNEASFSFLDGKELVHWPGRHTVDRGIRGEVNNLVELTAGLHYLEYYQEEVTLDQMAFLGWRPSGDEGPFAPVPESVFTAPHEGVVRSYESPKGPLPVFEPAIQDSLWPAERHEGQYTRVRFQAGPGLPAGTTYEWEFGDGLKAAGADVDHLYLTLGTFPVTLTARTGGEVRTARWPMLVFEIEHVTDQYRDGKPADYARAAKAYDRSALPAEALKELAYLVAEAEDPAGALEVGRDFVKRFGAKGEPLMVAQVRRLMADCAIRLGEGSLDEAIKNYQASLVKEMPAVEKVDVLGRLIRLVGLERNLPDRGVEFLDEVDKIARDGPAGEELTTAHRHAVNAAGDVRLWQGKRAEAQKLYDRVEKLNPRIIPPQVRAARIGAYPNSLREYVASGNYGAALDLVDQWGDLFATDKLNGQTFFWRGKVLALRGQERDAALALELAVRLTVGSAVETEARWLRAEVLEKQGKTLEAKKELARLIATGLNDDFTRKARERLKK